MHMSNISSHVLDCLNMFEDVIFKILFTQRKYFFYLKINIGHKQKKNHVLVFGDFLTHVPYQCDFTDQRSFFSIF